MDKLDRLLIEAEREALLLVFNKGDRNKYNALKAEADAELANYIASFEKNFFNSGDKKG
jgi:hypothetical protein